MGTDRGRAPAKPRNTTNKEIRMKRVLVIITALLVCGSFVFAGGTGETTTQPAGAQPAAQKAVPAGPGAASGGQAPMLKALVDKVNHTGKLSLGWAKNEPHKQHELDELEKTVAAMHFYPSIVFIEKGDKCA